MTQTVTSADGTAIAYEVLGEGPAVVLVPAAMNLRGSMTELAQALAPEGFTVVTYDRRARGESDDAAPLASWDLQREVEDIGALLGLVGGRAALFGSSSGCAVCLCAAASGADVSHLALWELPLPLGPADNGAAIGRLRELVEGGDRAGALEFYMRDMPPQWLEGAKNSPYWEPMQAMAPSLGYDQAALDWIQSEPLSDLLGKVTAPTLVMRGEEGLPIFAAAAEALQAAMPHVESTTVAGANHQWQTEAMVARLTSFFRS
jgi:pimeloyl-ACP methyl ester carboxylesterase